jgi:glyoxylase-like metal-dependent hydrolase (beta-lactamase superfamily II)
VPNAITTKTITRLAGLVVAASAVLASTALAVKITKDSKLEKSQAGYYRMKVGDVAVVALSDGTISSDVTSLLTNTKPGEVKKLLANAFVEEPIDSAMNAFLILLGNKVVLVDAGAGNLLGPKCFKLPESLKAAGYTPAQVTDILVTHIHIDHVGGLVDGEKRVFPNAIVHVSKRELAFWTDKSARASFPELIQEFFKIADISMNPYLASNQVKAFEPGEQLFPGIATEAAYGHTAGMTYYVLESRGAKLVFWGDTMNIPEVQFPNPSITIQFDTDSEKALVQRKKAFADATQNRYLVALPHMHFPGIGHVQKDGSGYRFIPVVYVNDAQKSEVTF